MELTVIKPVRVFIVPSQVMASKELAVVGGNVGGNVATCVIVHTTFGLGELPFHVVGRSDFTEDASVVQDGHVLQVLLFLETQVRTKL